MVFGGYADYYDLFYQNKNYAAECRFLQGLFTRYAKRPVEQILDLGCGTGGHALALMRRGFQVTGVDSSARMLSIARRKAAKAGLALELVRAKLQDFQFPRKFDAVICMFSVIDYLTKGGDLKRMLANVRRHLRPGGIFICDFWHAPAVAAFTPHKSKAFRRGDLSVERTAHTRLLAPKRLCEVHYQCAVRKAGRRVQAIHEVHRMRYFDIEEMNVYLGSCGLVPLAAGPFLNIHKPVRKNTWDVAVVACLPAGKKPPPNLPHKGGGTLELFKT